MSASTSIFVNTILLFLLIFVSGLRLSRRGKPYSTMMTTIHKLIGFATGVYLSFVVFNLFQVDQINTISVVAASVTVLFFLALTTSGGLLSAGKILSGPIKSTHRFLPYITVVSTILLILFLS